MSALARSRLGIALAIVAALVVALVVGLGRHSARPAVAATEASPATVTVTGTGTANGAPDTLSVQFSVNVTRPTVQEALDAQAFVAKRLFNALRKDGVAQKDIQTTDLSLDRHYDNHGNVTGYDASESVQAKISPLSEAGKAISAGATASGNNISVGSLSFDIAHDAALVTRARSAAFADAMQKAQQYAGLSDRSLGRVEKISERISEPNPEPIYYDHRLAANSAAASVPLRAGRQALTVNVTVVWELT